MAWNLLETRSLVAERIEGRRGAIPTDRRSENRELLELVSATMVGRVLGIDLGERRIGLAISDEDGRFAFPAGFHERRDLAGDLEALRTLAVSRGAVRIVVGLPLLLEGREGTGARAARGFAEALRRATLLPVELVDERLTTREAERALAEAPRKTRRGRKQVIDAMAATLLLRGWLDAQSRRDAGR